MDDLPLDRIAISGPTLASLIQRLSSFPGDVDGLIFGNVSRIVPSNLSDDSPAEPFASGSSSAVSSSQLVATVTSFICSGMSVSFYDPLGRVDPRRIDSLRVGAPGHILGWFSARRKTANRPSMREFSVTSSLSSQHSHPIEDSQNPSPANIASCVFFLFTTPPSDQFIHTHEYRAYQFCSSNQRFEPRSIGIVNIGPAFRGHYGTFSPNSAFPLLNCELRSSPMSEDQDEGTLSAKKHAAKAQKEIDALAEGFQVGNLRRMMGAEASNYTGGLEELYERMLAKIESLASLVEKSSTRVFEQDNENRKLRYRVSRIEQ
ncbi:PREDICTED: uncharacterized protein LOC104823306 [Tarenaya hassleriana]|uniref:uncharacterized protein LOC104823306 n=1 Tax=Tarenaya hassleriana TaxID=28532 RepID=UPI00053C7B18|nr:PREDICTED: uncharacterized protein LOC104823306 [Tarenaya hassleriana]